MKEFLIHPEKELKTLWYFTWAVLFIIAILVSSLLFLFTEIIIFAIFSGIALILLAGFLIWIPKAFRVLEYQVDDEGIKMKAGVVWKKFVTVPYSKVTNVDLTQGPLQRYFKIGTIHVQTAGAGGKQGEKAELKLNGVRALEEIRNAIIANIRQLMKSAQKEPVIQEKAEGNELAEILVELKELKDIIKRSRGQ